MINKKRSIAKNVINLKINRNFYKILLYSFLLLSFFTISNISIAKENFLPSAKEERAQKIFLQVKCLVCEGQVIGNSSTPSSLGLRKLIRQKIKNGLSDKEIKNILVLEYGPEILTTPQISSQNIYLWLLPFLLMVFGFILILLKTSRKKSKQPGVCRI